MVSSYSEGCPSAGADQASRTVTAVEALIGVAGAGDAAGAGAVADATSVIRISSDGACPGMDASTMGSKDVGLAALMAAESSYTCRSA